MRKIIFFITYTLCVRRRDTINFFFFKPIISRVKKDVYLTIF